MKNQRYSYSPTSKHTKKRNNFPEKDGHYYADLFFTQGTLINPPTIEQSDTPEKDFEDQTVDTELFAKIFSSHKSKIQHSPQYPRNEKELEKRRKLKLKKKEQTITCERLSSLKPRSSFQSPLFSEKNHKKFVSPFQANKEFIISRFYGVEEQITQRQLEKILHYFTIIEKNINEKPLVVKYILPLCQIENSNDDKLFDSQKLKDILFQSFQKASTNSFWKDISNCIISARINGKKTFIPRVSTPQKIRPNIHSNNTKDDNLEYYSCLSDEEYSASPQLNKYYEEIDEEQKQRKQKLNPITEEMSDTMIDEECNFVASNNSYNELFQKQKNRVKSPMKTNQLKDQENDSNESQERSEEKEEKKTDNYKTQEICEEEEEIIDNYETQEKSEEEEKVDNNELKEKSEEENNFILNIDDSFASYRSNKKDVYDAKEKNAKGTLIRNFNNVEICNYEEDGNELYTEEEFQNLIHEMTDSENEEEEARSPNKQAKSSIRASHSRRKNQSDSSNSNFQFFKQLKVIEKAQIDSPVSKLRRVDDDNHNWIQKEWNQSQREAGYTNDKIEMDSLTNKIKQLKTQNSQLKSDNSKLMTNYRCLKNSNMKLKTDNQQLKTKNEELTEMTRQMKKLKSYKIMLENNNKKLKSDNFILSTTNEKLKKQEIKSKEKNQELSQKVEQLTAENSQLKDGNFQLENANFKLNLKNQNLIDTLIKIEELKDVNSSKSEIARQLQQSNNSIFSLKTQLEGITKQFNDEKQEKEAIKSKFEKYQKEINKLKDIIDFNGISNLKQKLESLQNQVLESEKKEIENKQQNDSLQNELNKLRLQCESQKKTIQSNGEQLKKMQLQSEKLSESQKTSDQQVIDLKKQIEELKANISTTESIIHDLHELIEFQDFSQFPSALNDLLNAKVDEINELKRSKSQLENSIEQQLKNNESLKNKNDKMEKDLNQLKSEVRQNKSLISSLKEELKNNNEAASNLEKEKNSNAEITQEIMSKCGVSSLDELPQLVAGMKDKIDKGKEKRKKLNETLTEAQNKIKNLDLRIADLTKKTNDLESFKNKTLKDAESMGLNSIDELPAIFKQLKNKINEYESQIEELTNDKNHNSNIQKSLSEANSKIEELTEKLNYHDQIENSIMDLLKVTSAGQIKEAVDSMKKKNEKMSKQIQIGSDQMSNVLHKCEGITIDDNLIKFPLESSTMDSILSQIEKLNENAAADKQRINILIKQAQCIGYSGNDVEQALQKIQESIANSQKKLDEMNELIADLKKTQDEMNKKSKLYKEYAEKSNKQLKERVEELKTRIENLTTVKDNLISLKAGDGCDEEFLKTQLSDFELGQIGLEDS